MAFDPRLGERFVFEQSDLEPNHRGVVSDERDRGFEERRVLAARARWASGPRRPRPGSPAPGRRAS